MNIKHYIVLLACCLLSGWNACAQKTMGVGLLPALYLNKKLPQGWGLHGMGAGRIGLHGHKTTGSSYLLTDISLLASKKLGVDSRVSGGILLRLKEGRQIYRAIQQFSWVSHGYVLTLGHRLVTDQTFDKTETTVFRLRYRLAGEIPLSGTDADVGETYLKPSGECLNIFKSEGYDLEVRGVALLGWNATARCKLELGADYRISAFLEGQANQQLWIRANCFVKL